MDISDQELVFAEKQAAARHRELLVPFMSNSHLYDLPTHLLTYNIIISGKNPTCALTALKGFE